MVLVVVVVFAASDLCAVDLPHHRLSVTRVKFSQKKQTTYVLYGRRWSDPGVLCSKYFWMVRKATGIFRTELSLIWAYPTNGSLGKTSMRRNGIIQNVCSSVVTVLIFNFRSTHIGHQFFSIVVTTGNPDRQSIQIIHDVFQSNWYSFK